MNNYQKTKEILNKIAETGIVKNSDIEIINKAINSDEKISFQVGKNVINIGKGEALS